MKDSIRQQLIQLRPAMRPLAVLCALLALWLGWSGVAQFRDGDRRSDLEATRDSGVRLVHQALLQHQKRFGEALALPEVQNALSTSDFASASKVISAGWPNVSLVQVFPTDLETVYAALPKGGYGRLAVLESAMVENRIRTWVIRDLGQPRLALAAPAKVGDRLVGVVYIQLPFTELTTGLDTIGMVGDTYLGLRQGEVTLWERGEQGYADGAERLAASVAESGLRIVAATSQPPTQALGMGAVGPDNTCARQPMARACTEE